MKTKIRLHGKRGGKKISKEEEQVVAITLKRKTKKKTFLKL